MGNQIAEAVSNHMETVQIPSTPTKCCGNMSLKNTNKNIDSSSVSCSICFAIFNCPRMMKCKHNYCTECINDWGKGNTVSCPYCRTELKKNKGTYGRIDRKTINKIQKLCLKCRNCQWKGSIWDFKQKFSIPPYFDSISPAQEAKQNQNSGQVKVELIATQKQVLIIEQVFQKLEQTPKAQRILLSKHFSTQQKLDPDHKQQNQVCKISRKISLSDKQDVDQYLHLGNHDC